MNTLPILPVLHIVADFDAEDDFDTFSNLVTFNSQQEKSMSCRAIAKRFEDDEAIGLEQRQVILAAIKALIDPLVDSVMSIYTRRELAACLCRKLSRCTRVSPLDQSAVTQALIQYLFLRHAPSQLLKLTESICLSKKFYGKEKEIEIGAEFFFRLRGAGLKKKDIADYFLQLLIDNVAIECVEQGDQRLSTVIAEQQFGAYEFACFNPVMLLETLSVLNFPSLPLVLLPRPLYQEISAKLANHPHASSLRAVDTMTDIFTNFSHSAGSPVLLPASFKRRHAIKTGQSLLDVELRYDHWLIVNSANDRGKLGFFCVYEKFVDCELADLFSFAVDIVEAK